MGYTNLTTALILAGGFGKRLATVVSDRAKPAAIVNGRPFIHYLFDQLQSSGCISEIIVCAGIKPESIIEAISDYSEGIKISFIIEPKPLGTGGAIRNSILNAALDFEEVLVLNGDSYVAFPIKEFVDYHRCQENNDMSMVLIRDSQKRFGSVIQEGGKVVGFLDSCYTRSDEVWKNAGIYFFGEEVLKRLRAMEDIFSIENDSFMRQAQELDIRGFCTDADFIDIGIPEDFKKASAFMNSIRN